MLAVSMSPPVAHYSTVQKRPKLSLQTSELPITYGTSSRGLSTIATPSAAVTPTTFNTFNNTYDLTHRPSPTSATASPSLNRTASVTQRERLSRSQSPRPKRTEAVYTVSLPYGIRPVLKNTPYPRVRTNSISASPRSSTRKIFFPVPKQVVFRNNIDEEIVNRVYTARHSDLFDCDVQPEDGLSEDSDTEGQEISISAEESDAGTSISISTSSRKKCRRDSVDLVSSVNSQPETSTVATPSNSRRSRKWEWTLAPLPQSHPKAESPSDTRSVSKPGSKPEPYHNAGHTSSGLNIELEQQPQTRSESATLEQKTSNHQTLAGLESASSECDESGDRFQPTEPHSLQTQGDLQLKRDGVSTLPPRPTLSTIQSTRLNTLSLSPPMPSLLQRRAGSLDASPRKRKADCLEVVPTASSAGMIGITGGNSPTCMAIGDGAAPLMRGADPGRTGFKRRERAATL